MSINNILNNGQNVFQEVDIFDTYTLYGNRDNTLPWQSWTDMVAARGGSVLMDFAQPPRAFYAVVPPGPEPGELFKIPQGGPTVGFLLSLPEGPSFQPSPWKVVPITWASCPPGLPNCHGTTPSTVDAPEPSYFIILLVCLVVLSAVKIIQVEWKKRRG